MAQKELSKGMKDYIKHLNKSANEFKITAEDLSNIYDLLNMMDTPWEIQKIIKMDLRATLKSNNMIRWYRKFFNRIEDIVLYDPERDCHVLAPDKKGKKKK